MEYRKKKFFFSQPFLFPEKLFLIEQVKKNLFWNHVNTVFSFYLGDNNLSALY